MRNTSLHLPREYRTSRICTLLRGRVYKQTLTRLTPRPELCQGAGEFFQNESSLLWKLPWQQQNSLHVGSLAEPYRPYQDGPMATLSTLTPLSTDHHSFFSCFCEFCQDVLRTFLRVLGRTQADDMIESLGFEIFCSFGIRIRERATALSSRGTGYKSAQQTPQ